MSATSILVINCGSSSVKFSLFDDKRRELASALAERLGCEGANLTLRHDGHKQQLDLAGGGHAPAINALIDQLSHAALLDNLAGIGHRVVHGGEHFAASVRIDREVMQKIERCNHLAPLHNPANVLGIKLLQQKFPQLPQVAVFDTAFHQSLPQAAYVYGLPYEYYQKFGLRRYGFHGTSHRYVASEAVRRLGLNQNDSAIITAHLGNGCSACAVRNGRSVDTTMGLTPLEGLLMGTRSGDIDPSIHQFLAGQLDTDLAGVTDILNKHSGLLGVSGLSNDMRTLCEAAEQGHQRARLAIDIFCYRLAKTIGALAVPLGRLDALVFTGGIGENARAVRAQVLDQLSLLGFAVDGARNATHGAQSQGLITTDAASKALVIATQEEWMIASDTLTLIT